MHFISDNFAQLFWLECYIEEIRDVDIEYLVVNLAKQARNAGTLHNTERSGGVRWGSKDGWVEMNGGGGRELKQYGPPKLQCVVFK